MSTKMILLIGAVVIVVLGAILIATPKPDGDNVFPPFASENVKVSSPLPNATVAQNFTVSGYARGIWFFEASFPVEVRDPQNNLVGIGIAQAVGEWMTEEFVAFNAPVTVQSYTGPATLVLKKDNPSGLPEHNDSESFSIVIQ